MNDLNFPSKSFQDGDEPFKIAILGAGQLGRGVLTGLMPLAGDAGIQLAATTRRRSGLIPGVWTLNLADDTQANRRLAAWADVVILGVLPGQTLELAAEISGELRAGSTLGTFAIGVRTLDLESRTSDSVGVFRAMPNLPVEVRRGIIGLSLGSRTSAIGLTRVRGLFELLGTVLDIPDEKLDVLGMISGSGPAYISFLLDEFTTAAQAMGFGRATAMSMVRETFQGTMTLLDATGGTSSALLANTASPGSATERAIAILADGALAERAERGMRAAVARAEELRHQLRG